MKVEVVVGIGGLGLAMLALAFAAFQTRFTGQQAGAAERQVKIGNDINGAAVTNNVVVNLHDVLRIIVDYPELYPLNNGQLHQGQRMSQGGCPRALAARSQWPYCWAMASQD
jgi:hypothetical protein